jgi:hypothetical protein
MPTLGFRRINRQRARRHPVHQFTADAAHGDFGAGAHIVQHQHHAAGGQAAKIRISLDQAYRGTLARRCNGGTESGRATTDDDNVGAGRHAQVARRFSVDF